MGKRVEIKVADKVAELLETLGITHAFGIIGAGNVHLFEAISARGFTEIICVHHEQSATMAMQGYYRVTGRLSAVLLTTGGGSTNGVTGVVSAWADSIPGLIIAGNENAKYIADHHDMRMWGVQGYDSVHMVEKVTKYAVRVTDAAQTLKELQKAADISVSGRGGPVWVEIPMNIQSTRIEETSFATYEAPALVASAPSAQQVQSVVVALKSAKRPLLWLGHGIRMAGAEAKLPALLEQMGVPAILSWAGADMIASSHPLVVGRAGVYGQRAANFALQNCDYLLSIGTRMALPQIGYDINELARGARIDVVDIDPKEARKLSSRVSEAVVADAGHFIDALMQQATALPVYDEWREQCGEYMKRYPWIGKEHADRDGFINSYPFMPLLEKYLRPDEIVVTDMGTALLCAHQALGISGQQRLLTSTGLGEMGFGLPAAIGASIAKDNAEIICLNCDGGMMMNLQELQTVVHHQLPIKIFIFNNDGYLMIKHTQKSLFAKNYVGTDKKSGLSCPDYSKIANAFDMPAYQIRTWQDAKNILPQVMAHKGPVICEVFMHPEQPFVPKLSLSSRADGSLVSPPLEDLSPLLPLDEMERAMLVGMHEKSRSVR